MNGSRLGSAAALAVLSAACSAVLGFEDAVLGPDQAAGAAGIGVAGTGGRASAAASAGSAGAVVAGSPGGAGGMTNGGVSGAAVSDGGAGLAGTGAGGTPACTSPDQTRCESPGSNVILGCDVAAGAYVYQSTCAMGERCRLSDATCQPIAPGCDGESAGDIVCFGAILRICGPDLVTSTDSDCGSPALCKFRDGSQCAVCTPGQNHCDGADLQRCEPDHQGFSIVAHCTSPEACDATAGQCIACQTQGDCAVPDDPCKDVSCPDGTCKESLVSPGTPSRFQKDHDCTTVLCDVDGHGIPTSDPTDLPAATGACQVPTCGPKGPTFVIAPVGTDCGSGQVCASNGACVDCLDNGAVDCLGDTPRTCTKGAWSNSPACSGTTSMCDEGDCIAPPPSCMTTALACGPLEQSCCVSYTVPGGSFLMGSPASDLAAKADEMPEHAVTVSSFRLDAFEVTVARFRAFVSAYPGSKPSAGDGALPSVMGSGWQSAWDSSLPVTAAELSTNVGSCAGAPWTLNAGANEGQPMACLTWYEAFAFCAWDQAHLPSEAQREYAAAGGDSNLLYPPGASAPPLGPGCASVSGCVASPGSSAADRGRWGQFDLAGSVAEHVFDWYDAGWYNGGGMNCVDCAAVTPPGGAELRVRRGGSSSTGEPVANERSAARFPLGPAVRDPWTGVRCAR